MEIIVHRINKLEELKNINPIYGVEIDISYGNELILNHEPFKKGDKLKNFLKEYKLL